MGMCSYKQWSSFCRLCVHVRCPQACDVASSAYVHLYRVDRLPSSHMQPTCLTDGHTQTYKRHFLYVYQLKMVQCSFIVVPLKAIVSLPLRVRACPVSGVPSGMPGCTVPSQGTQLCCACAVWLCTVDFRHCVGSVFAVMPAAVGDQTETGLECECMGLCVYRNRVHVCTHTHTHARTHAHIHSACVHIGM